MEKDFGKKRRNKKKGPQTQRSDQPASQEQHERPFPHEGSSQGSGDQPQSQQAAWGKRWDEPPSQQQEQRPQHEGTWQGRGDQPQSQQGAWGERRDEPPSQQQRQKKPHGKGAWQGRGDQSQSQQRVWRKRRDEPPSQQPQQRPSPHEGAGQRKGDQPFPEQQQQGPEARSMQAGGQQHRQIKPHGEASWQGRGDQPQSQQEAWGQRRDEPPSQQPQQRPSPHEGARQRRGVQPFPEQQQQQGPEARSMQAGGQQQRQIKPHGEASWQGRGDQPQSQQEAWGQRRDEPPSQQPQQRPSPHEGAGQRKGVQPFPEQQQQQGPEARSMQAGGQKGTGALEKGTARDSGSFFQFPPRIYDTKKSGKRIIVASNFFRLYIANPNLVVFHYDVSIEPDKPKFLMRDVWNKFVSLMFPKRLTAFDGKNAYSNGPLTNDASCSATVTVHNSESLRDKEFKVSIKEVRRISLSCFNNYRERMLQSKDLKVLPEAEISVLEIIMRNWAMDNNINSGKTFFSKDSRRLKLSDKLDMLFGFYQAAFLGYVPYLNFEISHKAFYKNVPVLNLLDCFKDRYRQQLDLDEMNSFLRTVKVEYQIPNDPSSRRIFRVNKLVNNALTQTFTKEDKSKQTVAEYFEREKKCRLRYPDLPLLWVGPTQKTIYIPMEFCTIVPNQVYKGLMDPFETREMVRSATMNARDRQASLYEVFDKARINSQPLMKEFGLSVSDEMEQIQARIIDPPNLQTSRNNIRVNEGVWRSREFLEPKSLNKWCVLNLDKRTPRGALVHLQNMIRVKGNDFNMAIGNPTKDIIDGEPTFAGLKKVFSILKGMEMVFVVIPETKGLYAKVKTICETQEGILTQCVKSRTVSQDPRKLSTTVENILLKVNSKLGGKNHSLNVNSVPNCLKGNVMLVGADVTHPSPGVKIPSVAAVAVSCDPTSFQYGTTIRVQPKGEMIRDMQEIMTIHLKRFQELRKAYPEKIIIFRDGVSEGEMPKVLKSELLAIRNACATFCQPKITFVVVQKRHHTRFYPTCQADEQGRNFNVPVGTCVDSDIVHPRDLEFYLLSHNSILGTARPTKYRLLYDDNKLTDEELERLSYYLCHLFARCNRSVSYPSPTYNAHLAAFRARAYLEGLNVTSEHAIEDIQKKMRDNISMISPMFFV